MIACVVCKGCKAEEEFNWRNKANGIRKNYCRECDRVIRKRNYENNKDKQIRDSVDRNARIRQAFKHWKNTLACVICGEAEEACLDFHHVDGSTKEDSISYLMSGYVKSKIVDELNECTVLCACCHRKVHKYGWDAVAGQLPLVPLNVNASLVFNGNMSSFQVEVEGSNPS